VRRCNICWKDLKGTKQIKYCVECGKVIQDEYNTMCSDAWNEAVVLVYQRYINTGSVHHVS